MNWKRILAHTILNGIGTGAAMVPAGVPLTAKTVGLPIAASILTGLYSLFSQTPQDGNR